MAGRLREGEAQLGHEPHRQLAPDGGDRLAPPSAAHLLGGNARPPALAADPPLGGLKSPGPPPLGLEAGIPRLEHLFHEGTGPKDPGIGQDRLLALADGPDLGPAAQGADEAAPHQLGAAPLGEAFFQVTPVGAAGCWFVLPEPGQDGGTILPGRGLVAE